MRRFFAKEDWQEEEYPVDISTEEAEVMEGEAAELGAEINEEVAEAERMLDVADSLEDMAVVVDQIDEATPAETQLVQVAGDLATAGSDEVDASDVVPATESFVGRRIAAEGFVQKAKEIWARIKQWLKDIWTKIEKFFYKLFGVIPRERKKLEALRKRLEKVEDEGLSIDKEKKTFEISSGVGVLTVGATQVKKYDDFSTAFEKTKTAVSSVLVDGGLKKFGNELQKAIEKYEPKKEASADSKLADVNADVNVIFTKLIKELVGNVAASPTSRWTDQKVHANDGLLNGKALVVRKKKTGTNSSTLQEAEEFRSSRVEFTTLSDKTVKTPDSIKFQTMTLSECSKAVEEMEKFLNVLEKFHRGNAKKEIFKANDDVIKACDKLEKSDIGDDDKQELLPYVRAMYKYGAMYTNVSVKPMTQAHDLGLMSIRTLSMLVSRSLSCYSK